MGNRTYLVFEKQCEFEANNCIPVTWLALFEPHDFFMEENVEEKDLTAGYKTHSSKALQRLAQFINQLQKNPIVWSFFRPLEILRDELSACSQETAVILDLTQFWTIDEEYQDRILHAANIFEDVINRFTQNKEADLISLNTLVNQFALGHKVSLADITCEDLMFVLIGMYWGDPEKEAKYSLEYFNASYWAV
jgi:hypothetical protein